MFHAWAAVRHPKEVWKMSFFSVLPHTHPREDVMRIPCWGLLALIPPYLLNTHCMPGTGTLDCGESQRS